MSNNQSMSGKAKSKAYIDGIRRWMSAPFLTLNDSKTELVCFSAKDFNTKSASNPELYIGHVASCQISWCFT